MDVRFFSGNFPSNLLLASSIVQVSFLGPVYTIKFSVIKVEIFRWEILGFEVFLRNY